MKHPLSFRSLLHTSAAALIALLLALLPLLARGAEPDADADADAEPAAATQPTSRPANPIPDKVFAGLKVRLIGPAFMSGRIGDIAVDPHNHSRFYLAVASGGVWRTTNAGTTFTPVFDHQGSYSIGCITIDPSNPHTVYVGTGENNSQRSVGFGDGIYRSRDDGAHWENLGLKSSEHIGRIIVHPSNPNIIYVAAQGPLWKAGGDRGLYKTTDGGKTWNCILKISDNTGVNEVLMDPRDPDTLYASAYQRRRRVWTLIDGGPESAIYKSTDAGKSWRKITNGIPGVDLGRIGMAISPANPDILYAVIEAANDKGGFFRSTDRGESWQKRSSLRISSPQYFNEIFADPVDADRVYSCDVMLKVSDDGGKTFRNSPSTDRHVDNHALWIDPADNRHLRVGCDGGLYESFDLGANWRFATNLPITQFYRISTDNGSPFYNVYGGTQDNASEGGPSRTTDRAGITNCDWFTTVGGDGYQTVVDPTDPNILYAMWQYGGLVRHDRRSGEILDIKPRESVGETPLKWNWDSPLILSPHDPHRLYFAANKLFESNDQGNSWKAISGDLTRGIDRSKLPVMGRIQPVDAVARGMSTSYFGNCTALCESPLKAGLLMVGTDDGLVHVSPDDGKTWTKIESFPGVPAETYVSGLTASRYDANTFFACFDNHKNGDFKPYLLKTTDLGKTWTRIAGNLPERETVYCLRQDHVKPDLLFAGTEFGAYFTLDAGEHWTRIPALPTIAVRDIAIQRRENDLVLGTFGRSIYILDNYAPLRTIDKKLVDAPAHIFPIKDALRYIERSRLGGRNGRGSQGATFYNADNPPFGAIFTYYLKDKPLSLREQRQKAEKKAIADHKPVTIPSLDELRKEDQQIPPQVLMVVRDDQGKVVRRIPADRDEGIHRVDWDLRYPSAEPIRAGGNDEDADKDPDEEDAGPSGPLALPGTYTATLVKVADANETVLAGPVAFNVIPLEIATFAAKDKAAVLAFQTKVAHLQRAVDGAVNVGQETESRLKLLRRAILQTPAAGPDLLKTVDSLSTRLDAIMNTLRGDPIYNKYQEPTPTSIRELVQTIIGGQWRVTSPPTQTQRDAYDHAADAFEKTLGELRTLVEKDMKDLDARLDAAGAPWTPGRMPTWKKE